MGKGHRGQRAENKMARCRGESGGDSPCSPVISCSRPVVAGGSDSSTEIEENGEETKARQTGGRSKTEDKMTQTRLCQRAIGRVHLFLQSNGPNKNKKKSAVALWTRKMRKTTTDGYKRLGDTVKADLRWRWTSCCGRGAQQCGCGSRVRYCQKRRKTLDPKRARKEVGRRGSKD